MLSVEFADADTAQKAYYRPNTDGQSDNRCITNGESEQEVNFEHLDTPLNSQQPNNSQAFSYSLLIILYQGLLTSTGWVLCAYHIIAIDKFFTCVLEPM